MSKAKNTNAFKHGAFSKMILLPGEDREEFEALHKSLVEEWDPQGPTQEDKVFNIAQNMWRKRRSTRYVQIYVDIAKKVELKEEREFEVLLKFVDDVEAGKPISELKLPARWNEFCKKRFPREKYDSDAAWLEDVTTGVLHIAESHALYGKELSKPMFADPFCDAEVLEKDLALEERIDSKIDRDITALGRMKTMQSMGLGRRRAAVHQHVEQVEPPPLADESNDNNS